jgi:transcriptional regulator with XRE-family HTH domain
MSTSLTPEEVAIIIRARRLLKEKGLSPDTDVKTLCGEAGISRKTGYQWEKRLDQASDDERLREELARLTAEHEKLKKAFDDVSWENEGRKVAWEIHEVDAMIAEKKALRPGPKRKSRSVFTIHRPAGTKGRLGVGDSVEHPVGLESGL